MTIGVQAELQAKWSELAQGLQLDRYIHAVLVSVLVYSGDVRTLSMNGGTWRIQVKECKGAEEVEGDGRAAAAAGEPWFVAGHTRIRISPVESAGGDGDSGSGGTGATG